MKNPIRLAAGCLLLLLLACKKERLSGTASLVSFKQYTIPKGGHYARESSIQAVETGGLKFVVRFDSSAVYRTADPENQYDINKLYGFSDNGQQHQQFSARFGWRWSDEALRLFAYTYNNGERNEQELGVVPIGAEVRCAIRAEGSRYTFSLNGTTATMPRRSTTEKAKGYRLYPYFGGNEPAPHDVRVWIREEE